MADGADQESGRDKRNQHVRDKDDRRRDRHRDHDRHSRDDAGHRKRSREDRDDDDGGKGGDKPQRLSGDKREKHSKRDRHDRHEEKRGDKHRDKKSDKKKASRGDKGRGSSKRDRALDESEDSSSEEIPVPTLPVPGGVALRAADYFERATELRVWLLEEKGIYSDELPSEKARALFKLFARAWNSGSLPPKYYQGLPETQIAAASRTRHKWAFAAKLTDDDRMRLESTKDNVDTNTHRDHARVT
eukprot:CAMPEP_0185163006 /NCGR_PEP_ID=MMETSP1139-20130426/7369_1 /TAXON_ID=298111 /ORGANISM="Pavlova sp., Strain CCMP459" /LENGTH=244 /DNA_ID=CAMNT_0027728351 /DNA_START=5 /DNA_END=739 /DNA_ORIENTATION=-